MRNAERLEARMGRFVEHVGAALETKPQRTRFAEYALGLLLPGDRKSMEPMAARIDPAHAMARYKTFQKFISVSEWSDHDVRRAAFTWARPALEQTGPPVAWIIDDTGFIKQGKDSVFVHRQYTGTAGKITNCQVAVSLSFATEQQSMPLDFELYMPDVWAKDAPRRALAKVPEAVAFRTKPDIAIGLIERAVQDGVPLAPVVADADYGKDPGFRAVLEMYGLDFAVGMHSTVKVLESLATGGKLSSPRSIRDLVLSHGPSALEEVTWREGTKKPLSSRFLAVRVRLPEDDSAAFRNDPELWLVAEWPVGDDGPSKYWMSNRPADTSLADLVALIKGRWRVERDYEDLKSELGLDHFEGRNYVGWNHHVSVCIAAFAFLLTERMRHSPPGAVSFETLAPPPQNVRRRGRPLAA
jgi:SRSO17 transposase